MIFLFAIYVIQLYALNVSISLPFALVVILAPMIAIYMRMLAIILVLMDTKATIAHGFAISVNWGFIVTLINVIQNVQHITKLMTISEHVCYLGVIPST